ncbi:MAG: winged helix-turn-helix domain-containing tetratricopeptide repeat protein [Sphingomonadaceae bacterium]
MAFAGDELTDGFGLGTCAVLPGRNVITLGGETISLEPKVMDVCCLLASRGGEVVSRDYLIDQIWGVKFGSDESLTRAIYILRRALSHASGHDSPIETISKKGYRLAVPVMPLSAPAPIVVAPVAPPPENRPSIAVLAFSDMSATQDQGYFSDGVAEEIINALIPLSGIRVAGRTSSFSFKGANKGISAIGEALGVDHVLEGSVRKQGEQLRIVAQLVDAHSDTHMWSHTYHGTVDSVFDLQDQIARSVCDELRVIFHLDEEEGRLAPALTASKEAYDLFLQGRALRARIFGERVLEQAEDFFKRAIALDPGFAEAWAELGYAYAQIAGYVAAEDRRSVLAQSFDAAQKAIDLKPDYGLPWMVQSWTPLTQGNFAESIRLAERACQLSPDDPDVLVRYGYYLAVIGRVKDGLPSIRKAIELDPIQGRNHMILSMALLAAGDIDAAEHHGQLAVGLQYHAASLPAALTAKAAGNAELAIERMVAGSETSLSRALISETATPQLWRMVGTIAFAGTDEQRVALTAQMLAMIPEPARRSDVGFLHILLCCCGYDAFFDAFGERAEPGNHIILVLLWCPFAPQNGLRDHPDFAAFAQRIGLTAAWDVYGLPDCWGEAGQTITAQNA